MVFEPASGLEQPAKEAAVRSCALETRRMIVFMRLPEVRRLETSRGARAIKVTAEKRPGAMLCFESSQGRISG